MSGVSRHSVGLTGVIELAEPDSRNALSGAVRRGTSEALELFERNGAAAIVITGQGTAFSAGGDLRAMPADERGGYDFIREVFEWFEEVQNCPVPTIAAVNGPAIGGGAELAIACDMVVTAAGATFGFPETGIGLMAPYAAARLQALIPLPIAKELALTGRILTAEEAANLGLVNHVVATENLLGAAMELAGCVGTKAVAASRVTKALHNAPRPLTAEYAAAANASLFASRETQDRIQGFVDQSSAAGGNRRRVAGRDRSDRR